MNLGDLGRCCLSFKRLRTFQWRHSPHQFPASSVRAKQFSRKVVDEIHIRVLTNEHGRFICFGRFSSYF